MYLEKIEIQGFKSFAKKTVLKFAHESNKNHIGLTVIVGPNGSGKSNVADAVRWVLGEQSLKLLRGKRSEDVIFAGSNKKSSLSFAEVSLYLNNEDKKSAINYTQLAITRRLYRDGESEYLINNSKIRLIDMQLMLAKANFGQRAYSVVGQGMVDNFLNTTPSERKDFFDEACGVRMYQIKKHEADIKLKNTQNNLEQADNILLEIEPRMKFLTKQIKKLEKRAETEVNLKEVQKNYYAAAWHELSAALKGINKRIVEYEKNQRETAGVLKKINEELASYDKNQGSREKKDELEDRQRRLRSDRDVLSQALAEAKAQKNAGLVMAGKNDEAWLGQKAAELEKEINNLKQELRIAEERKTEANKQIVALRREQNFVDERIIKFRREIIDYHSGSVHDAQGAIQKIKESLKAIFSLHDEIEEAFVEQKEVLYIKNKFNRLRSQTERIKNLTEARRARHDSGLEKINSEIINLEEEKNLLTERYIKTQSEVSINQNSIARIEQELNGAKAELAEVSANIAQKQKNAGYNNKQNNKKEAELADRLKDADDELEKIADEIEKYYEEEKKQRDAIIDFQKKNRIFQEDYNKKAGELNEALVEKARVETKLEDLENEIRREAGGLRDVIEFKNFEKIDDSEARAEIAKLKHQLEQIGGIDPEIAKEHEETKERYDFLQNQSMDLRKAITALRKVIAVLEKTITEKFDKGFLDISKQFEKYFKILFEGGSVRLEKIMEENKPDDEDNEGAAENQSAEIPKTAVKAQKTKIELRKIKKHLAGIDVMACPPNKKIKHVSSLSGGERALTSIALIAAIIAVNPSPFVMLDEVDAALDEANSVRLSRILEDLSKKTQFIAITHNRTIMYKADIIYGITMGDDGVSKLLSVKVDEVKGARR